MNPTEYREQLIGHAHLLRAEGLSQTAISKELGVPRERVRDWLNNGSNQLGDIRQPMENGDTRLAASTRYHVAKKLH